MMSDLYSYCHAWQCQPCPPSTAARNTNNKVHSQAQTTQLHFDDSKNHCLIQHLFSEMFPLNEYIRIYIIHPMSQNSYVNICHRYYWIDKNTCNMSYLVCRKDLLSKISTGSRLSNLLSSALYQASPSNHRQFDWNPSTAPVQSAAPVSKQTPVHRSGYNVALLHEIVSANSCLSVDPWRFARSLTATMKFVTAGFWPSSRCWNSWKRC